MINFDHFYRQLPGINPINDVCNIIEILNILEKMIESKDFNIINFDGKEFMKFHRFFLKIYLLIREGPNFHLTEQISWNYYQINAISLQVDYTIKCLESTDIYFLVDEDYNSVSLIEKEYSRIEEKLELLKTKLKPLDRICNFFCI